MVSHESHPERQAAELSKSEKRHFLQKAAEAALRGELEWNESTRHNVEAMSRDKDWEVRQDVAELLVHLPEHDFEKLAPRLLNDTTAYVKRAAEHSKQRRRSAIQEAHRSVRGLDQVATAFEQFIKKHGLETGNEAFRLGEARFELMSGALAHDLMGMMATVRNLAQILSLKTSKKDAEAKAVAADLNEHLLMMERSIKDLLTYSSTVSVKRTVERLPQVVSKAVQQTRSTLKSRGFDFSEVQLRQESIPDVELDISLHLVVSALCNLLKNALETFEGRDGKTRQGVVTVSAIRNEHHVEIRVHNSGKGLSDEKLRALMAWLPAHRNRNKKYSTGYGILNARKNIEEHCGTLRYESRLNEGVTAIVTLPL